MQALHPDLRKTLEKTVIEARDAAEEAATKALERLGVGLAKKPDYLTDAEAALRRRLRARGRALGDARRADGSQEAQKLTREAAYAHWHRLLFARFLLENDLLVHPEYGVPLGLEDCEALAAEEQSATGGRTDAFEVAARFAAALLPQIFRTDDAVLDLRLAPEDRTRLRGLVTGLAPATFHADDALGWVYQFWQAKRKDEVNASGVKIGAEELPAVTQLFTEEYMVRFLLENTLGAWWAARHPGEELPVEMPYLRFLDDEAGNGPTLAAGGFEGWPDWAAELKVMDPCMGSGHFLVAALHLLVPMRMAEEGLAAREAVDRVLEENLHGLELDLRCTQIAAFALALAAWTYPGAGGHRPLPPMNLACSGLAPAAKLDEWVRLAGDDERLKNGMRRLWTLFQDAPTLGSLIDPGQAQDDLLTAGYAELQPLLAAALKRETDDEEVQSQEVVAYGIATAAELLGGRYHLVATNVPYLGRGNQDETMMAFADRHYPEAKADLATVFVQRCLGLCARGGTTALVTPQNWLFLKSYRELRETLLKRQTWVFYAPLGVGAFETISGEVVNVALPVLTRAEPTDSHRLVGVDASSPRQSARKAEALRAGDIQRVRQSAQLENPDARVSLVEAGKGRPMSDVAICMRGIVAGDKVYWTRYFWEIDRVAGTKWRFIQSTVSETIPYGGRQEVIDWSTEGEGMLRPGSENEAYGRHGVAVSQMRILPSSLYTGELYDNSTAPIVPKEKKHLPAIWAFCSSSEFNEAVRRIDQKLNVTNATLVKVPFDLERWQKVADEQYPDGLPEPESDDPTQWLFHGHPAHAEDPSGKFAAPLHVAVARLVGYRWPAEWDEEMELAEEARALVREAATLDAYADEDGIVCLPPIARERPAVDRLQDLLRAAYGDRWNAGLLQKLLEQEGVKRGGLAKWLRDKYFANHCALFGCRPFVWHVTDGHREGFSALVNYHRLDRTGLEKLTYTYLGEWIARQRQAVAAGEGGADGRLAAAEALQRQLKRILEGEPPYDVFVRWKPLEEQPIGWDPDLNDGVLLNIRPFKEAGVLALTNSQQKRFKYTKDRGKNPEGEPWGPDRYNRYEDLDDAYKLRDEAGRVIPHLTNAVKKAARAATETATEA